MLSLWTPNDQKLDAILDSKSAQGFSYPEVGATAGVMPSGYGHDVLFAPVGKGREVYAQCSSFIDQFGLQQGAGFRVTSTESRVADGVNILMSRRIGPFAMVASARIVYTIHDERRHGFAYGTLPAHPEVGEEYFGVRLDQNDEVVFELRAFSRPGDLLARIGKPVTRMVQHAFAQKYREALFAYAQSVV